MGVQVVYVVIGAGLYLVFQDDTKSDVLLNFSAAALGPLIGARVADILTYVVWLGFAFNLIVRCPPSHAATPNESILTCQHPGPLHWRRTFRWLGISLKAVLRHDRTVWLSVQVTYPMIHWGLREVRLACCVCYAWCTAIRACMIQPLSCRWLSAAQTVGCGAGHL